MDNIKILISQITKYIVKFTSLIRLKTFFVYNRDFCTVLARIYFSPHLDSKNYYSSYLFLVITKVYTLVRHWVVLGYRWRGEGINAFYFTFPSYLYNVQLHRL